MNWQIVYLPSLQGWLDDLHNEKLESLTTVVQLLSLKGNNLRLPHCKPLKNGLFELREQRFGLRIYYTFSSSQEIICLKGGTKSTQKDDIIDARRECKRMRGKNKKIQCVKL